MSSEIDTLTKAMNAAMQALDTLSPSDRCCILRCMLDRENRAIDAERFNKALAAQPQILGGYPQGPIMGGTQQQLH